MSNYIQRVMDSITNLISELSENPRLFLRNSQTDFSRNRKIDFKRFYLIYEKNNYKISSNCSNIVVFLFFKDDFDKRVFFDQRDLQGLLQALLIVRQVLFKIHLKLVYCSIINWTFWLTRYQQ